MIDKAAVQGIFPPLMTPMHANEDVNYEQFEQETDFILSLPVTGVVVGGSTGEGHALTVEELTRLTGSAAQRAAGRVPVVTGIISTTTRDAIDRAKQAREAGATGLMVTPPIYQQPDLDNLRAYYDGIYQASGLPIIIYNVLPASPVTPAFMRELVKLDAIVGTKESAGSSLAGLSELLVDIGDDIAVTWATDHMMFPGFAFGAVGAISGTTSMFPKESIAMFDAIARNDYDTARKIHFALWPLMKEVMAGPNWPGCVKAVLNLQGRNAGPARSPYRVPTGERFEIIKAGLAHAEQRLAESGIDI
ncbi:dihydrodipicolinate synthase family protein [Streptomyces olivaceus]